MRVAVHNHPYWSTAYANLRRIPGCYDQSSALGGGKVVVVDVWATWCGPCKAMIPHERELVKRLKGKPFVLVSISIDAKKEKVKDFLKDNEMPWTHWWNGAKGGVISELGIKFIPTIHVLDAKGIIRAKGVRGEAMDKAVDKLLKELEESKKTS